MFDDSPLVTVKLRSLAVGGDAVGEVREVSNAEVNGDLLGITAFVPYGVPGEEVKARVFERKANFIKAEIEQVTENSWDRQDPPCPYFQVCGGCDLQHIDYRAQVEFKKEMVLGALRSAKFPSNILDKVPDVIKSEPFAYRRRIHLHVNSQGNIGFYKPQTRSIIAINNCLIAGKTLQPYLEKVHSIGGKIAGRINSIHLEEAEGKVLAVFIAPYELSPIEIRQIGNVAREIFSNIIVNSAGKEVFQEGHTSFKLFLNKSNSVYLRIPGGGFSQVNWEINKALIESVVGFFRSSKVSSVYDLFAGAGNFSISLAKERFQVVAVETDPRLVKLGRETAKEQGFLKNLKFEETSVHKFLKSHKMDASPESIGIVLDPPRSGLGQLVKQVDFGKFIILISCHLPSFVRDLKALTERGYEPTKIELYDMFPQTAYLESVAFLSKV